ncbi:hypothetical protein MSP8886_01344 [Marinomonas spartinae]|uniref:Uncharacterized protein n=1 Tax=Marinomonas spartinae TaxID=1792290 RepID=A0A1A8TAU8_9GAMM|nr:hypothetical protein [Marinomonas spartinae]SBS28873.1 hypothetical protein MSP8886_01344 [Marinomonas spartinae]
MVTVKRVEAGNYVVSDGRMIVKNGNSWYILKEGGGHDFGPVTTLSAAKEYVQTGISSVGQHNPGSAYGKRQSKKEFNAYLASEAKQGNYGPIILYTVIIAFFVILLTYIQTKK